ncbi:YgaP family membrane protein [Mangrovitalea sediminis]|uniref:YgaP family membrane protein n=1 Tax=Mangrovitalea sediminis TaxID=1982043 RepID=UPI0029DE7A03|nr:DUF2892 domain-containing protein [Mangrovitalea sediminis]
MKPNVSAPDNVLGNNLDNEKEAGMKCNVGKTDRTLRVVVGIVIVAAGVYFQSWWGAIGVIPIFTGATGWCPAYLPFGISTCKK